MLNEMQQLQNSITELEVTDHYFIKPKQNKDYVSCKKLIVLKTMQITYKYVTFTLILAINNRKLIFTEAIKSNVS